MLQAVVNLSQLVESDARREEAQHRERHHAALIAAIVCRIWQDRTRICPAVRQRPPRFCNERIRAILDKGTQVSNPLSLVSYRFKFVFSA